MVKIQQNKNQRSIICRTVKNTSFSFRRVSFLTKHRKCDLMILQNLTKQQEAAARQLLLLSFDRAGFWTDR
ncbi:MAG: hypothetical protein HFJ85_06875 [Oscillospiraceae bacterium]|nr:hypothetical protein [Oscillospiraceae bacterium]